MIKDKRKIDMSGKPKAKVTADQEAKAPAPAPSSEVAGSAAPAAAPEPVAATAEPAAAVPPVSGPTTPGPTTPSPTTPSPTTPSPTTPGPTTPGPAGEPEAAAAPAAAPTVAEVEALRSQLNERLQDLQRLGAEYANYRKRVERDRAAVVEQAVGTVVMALLPILDDLDRAREHGDLVGGFASVAEQLIATLSKLGLTGFGEVGDPFDPTRHDAVAHQTSPDVTAPTCVSVLRRGYLLGDRLLRAAMVAVADPE